jgi:glycosyltransferase involved in cell wall biosynthesis
MNILMMTNTYLPHVGGVARSVASFTEEFRSRGHRVLVIAPKYETLPEEEAGVVRVPSVTRFNGSDFSLCLPIPGVLSSAVEAFAPDVVHSHHPFLLGDTALRVAALRKIPLVFTHHTMYEQYTHYVSSLEWVRHFAVHLPTGYANLCDHVIAPSESVAGVLKERGVTTPASVIPTGIDPECFAQGEGDSARERYGIPADAFVVGHVGRLAPEKNLPFLARAVARFLQSHPAGRFLVVGGGPAEEEIRSIFAQGGAPDRLHLTGPLEGRELADAYHAMDVFAFASRSETQGMVLAEAMTAGVPVVALEAPGASDVVSDGENGRLLGGEDEGEFAAALASLARAGRRRKKLGEAARDTANSFSLQRCASQVLEVYEGFLAGGPRPRAESPDVWRGAVRLAEAEWQLWNSRIRAVVQAVMDCL